MGFKQGVPLSVLGFSKHLLVVSTCDKEWASHMEHYVNVTYCL